MPEPGTIADLNVSILMDHENIGDLKIELTHVDSGTTIVLVDQPGLPGPALFGCASNGLNVTLDDEGTGPNIEDLCGASNTAQTPPSPPNVVPASALSAFDGEAITGTWRLIFTDMTFGPAIPGATNALYSCCLSYELQDADGDGVVDAIDDCPADPGKSTPGPCGCGTPDTDTAADGPPACSDQCPANPDLIAPQGCGGCGGACGVGTLVTTPLTAAAIGWRRRTRRRTKS